MEKFASDRALLTPPLSEGEPELSLDDLRIPSKDACSAVFERKMGDTELSYFLPSRQTGVNDMYLHLGFRAPHALVKRPRVRAVWAILRLRHPLLSASVSMHGYDDVRFVYSAPSSPEDLLQNADDNLEYRAQTKDELIESYLNGPRTLSNTRLSYLVVSHSHEQDLPTPPLTPVPEHGAPSEMQDAPRQDPQHELLICAMHFLGDGMALHQFANEFFGLLGSEKTDDDLAAMLDEEWRTRWENNANDVSTQPEDSAIKNLIKLKKASILPSALEDRIPMKWSKLRSAAASVDFQMSQQKLVGGQAFPRRKDPERRTVVPTLSFSEARTKAILKKCKANGVSISAALFAICNVAWARVGGGSKELPALMYSALNLRPYFTVKRPSPWDSYWFIAIGYFNVVLPNFFPDSKDRVEAIFWHRARQAKEQSARAAKHPLLISRTHEMAKERGERARGWAKEDDEKEQGTWVPPAPASRTDVLAREPVIPARAKAPSTALIGLSLLGNLDGVYKHATFPSIKMHTLTTGSRQRHGAMLLFGYTFAGKLWISLGYDANGFADGVVDGFWSEAIGAVEEFLG